MDSYRRSNSARVRRSPFSRGGMAPLLGTSVGSTGNARGVDRAMGSASGTPASLEEVALTIIRDSAPARQRGPSHERHARKRLARVPRSLKRRHNSKPANGFGRQSPPTPATSPMTPTGDRQAL